MTAEPWNISQIKESDGKLHGENQSGVSETAKRPPLKRNFRIGNNAPVSGQEEIQGGS